jgi:WD40 repeat protein
VMASGPFLRACDKYQAPDLHLYINSENNIACVVALPDGTFATGSLSGCISIWDRFLLRKTAEWKPRNMKVHALGVLSDDLLVSADCALYIWEIATQRQMCTSFTGHVLALCIGRDGTIYVSTEGSHIIVLTFDAVNHQLHQLCFFYPTGKPFRSIAETHCGQLLAGCDTGEVFTWNGVDNEMKLVLRCPASVIGLVVLPDGRFVAGYHNYQVQIWDLQEAKCIQTLYDGRQYAIASSMAFAVLKNGFFVCANSRCLTVWK